MVPLEHVEVHFLSRGRADVERFTLARSEQFTLFVEARRGAAQVAVEPDVAFVGAEEQVAVEVSTL